MFNAMKVEQLQIDFNSTPRYGIWEKVEKIDKQSPKFLEVYNYFEDKIQDIGVHVYYKDKYAVIELAALELLVEQGKAKLLVEDPYGRGYLSTSPRKRRISITEEYYGIK